MGNPGIICLQQNLQMGIGLTPSFGVHRRTAMGRPQIQNKTKTIYDFMAVRPSMHTFVHLCKLIGPEYYSDGRGKAKLCK